jgi:BirA family biotin operon repressor/biotin-[acetyl-CoA-carboxylase] ligase
VKRAQEHEKASSEPLLVGLSVATIRDDLERLRGSASTKASAHSTESSLASAAPLRFGPSMALHAELASTMDVLADAASEGAPAGSVVIADHQTEGRGRLRRAWVAPPGTALMLSMLFRPEPSLLPPERMQELGMAVGMAAADALQKRLLPEARLRLKWPNDILVDGKKIAGLLAEATWASGLHELGNQGAQMQPAARPAVSCRVIVGIGINLRQQGSDLPEGATSLALRLDGRSDEGDGRSSEPDRRPADGEGHPGIERGASTPAGRLADPLDRSRLAAEVLLGVERWYARLMAGESLVPIWSQRLDTLGRRVVARRGDELLEGIAEGVEMDGALRIRLDDGRVERLRAGDVTLAR